MSRRQKVLFRHVRQIQRYGTTKGRHRHLKVIREVERISLGKPEWTVLTPEAMKAMDFVKRAMRRCLGESLGRGSIENSIQRELDTLVVNKVLTEFDYVVDYAKAEIRVGVVVPVADVWAKSIVQKRLEVDVQV